MPFPYATPDDVEIRWRTLTDSEQDVVAVLIEDAADIIVGRWPDIPGRIVDGAIPEVTLVRVIAGMVRRAMMNRDSEGVTQMQATAGPFSGGATYSNPNNNLYLTADDIRALDSFGFRGRSRMGWLA